MAHRDSLGVSLMASVAATLAVASTFPFTTVPSLIGCRYQAEGYGSCSHCLAVDLLLRNVNHPARSSSRWVNSGIILLHVFSRRRDARQVHGRHPIAL